MALLTALVSLSVGCNIVPYCEYYSCQEVAEADTTDTNVTGTSGTGTDDSQGQDTDSESQGDTSGTEGGTDLTNEPPLSPEGLELSSVPIKRFQFSWQQVADATSYSLEQRLNGQADFSPLLEGLPDPEASVIVPLHFRLGAMYQARACNDFDCSEPGQPIQVEGDLAQAVGYFKSPVPEQYDHFGTAVAIDADGMTLVVGAPWEDSGLTDDPMDNGAQNSGAAYVYVLEGEQWMFAAYLKSPAPEPNAQFGESVTISPDGTLLAVGAPFDDVGVYPNAGAAYVYVSVGEAWEYEDTIEAINANAGDEFGTSLALANGPLRLLIGAPREDSDAKGVNGDKQNDMAQDAGAAYLYERMNEQWQEIAYLKASNSGENDLFGKSVTLSAAGERMAVGAIGESSGVPLDPNDDSALLAGAVYIYELLNANWIAKAYLKSESPDFDDRFGQAIALSADGSTLVVGATGEDSSSTGVGGDPSDDSSSSSGAVYTFIRSGTNWTTDAYIKPSNTDSGDLFGAAVTMSHDGTTIAVGAPGESSPAKGVGGDETMNGATAAGAVHIFEWSAGAWQQTSYVKAPNTDTGDQFGISVVMSADGVDLAVGASREASASSGIGGVQTDNTQSESGAAYLF
jgi:hypothetical protein